QAFRRDWLTEAYAQPEASSATDDAALVERLGKPVSIVEGSPLNIKITGPRDLKLAEQILKSTPPPKPQGRHPFAGDDLWR
ncbi:MAG: 2-C-methyl-D-erythritol 4-phosphate cytidylyltransferase, partial [Planctomycetota bacterium]